MNQKTFSLLFAGTLLAVAVWGLRVGPSTKPAQEPEVSGDLDDLLKQRRDCLADALEATRQEFAVGRSSPAMTLYLSTELLDAELEVTKDQEARKQAHVAHLNVTQDIERQAAARMQNGTGTRQDVLTARAARLLAEIRLARLQGKQ